FAASRTELREHVRFYPVNSMAFYAEATQKQVCPDLVLIRGLHDYECALFEIQCAARLIRPNGFIFIDNISRPGPYFAARDFLKLHTHWRQHGGSMSNYRPEFALDLHRTTVKNTDLCVLCAPVGIIVGPEPFTPGKSWWYDSVVGGISLSVGRPATGKLH